MSYTVSVSETTTAVTAQDIVNSVSVSETDANAVTVVASTFITSSGAASRLYYSNGAPSDSLGEEGDFYIDVSAGQLWGPKGASAWPANELPLIPKRETFSQAVAASTWNITHSLKGFPSVTVVDSAGSVVIGDVSYNSTSSITITFQSAFAGNAYLT